jgi:N-acetylmuramoyl-L-alanine amidase
LALIWVEVIGIFEKGMKHGTNLLKKDNNVRRSILPLILLCAALSLTVYGQSQGKVNTIKTVVIDAGHGGKDPGCHGAYSNEKDVCLSMALKLGKLIKETYPDIKVKYTRETDVFIELIERANIANRANADLFICIHANAGSTTAYGTETYVLGLHRTESQQKVMERENSIISLEDDKGAKYKDFDLTPDAMIAIQLQQNVNLNNAIKFASFLQQEFKAIGRYDREVKQAGFLVLYKTAMPSVLIETGFLTNPNEEGFIGKQDGQEKMAKAMLKAFTKYKSHIEGKQETIKNNSSDEEPIKEPNEPKSLEIPTKDLFFSVQIVNSPEQLPQNSRKFKGEKVFVYEQDNIFKYCSGTFLKDIEAAKKHKIAMQNKGFEDAFVVAFYNGVRISIEKATKLAEN